MTPGVCPRCRGTLRAPDLWSASWRCAAHGDVAPLTVHSPGSSRVLADVALHSRVPVWLPHPAPTGWTLSGVAHAGDDRTGALAVAVAMSGPCPTGGPADLVLVAEEPGVGLAAGLAGLSWVDPGVPEGAAEAKVHASGHPTALWAVPEAEAWTVVGEAKGLWLWVLAWPDTAALVMLEHLVLHDVRRGLPGELVVGAACPHLNAA
jgi:hypothetical protein